MEYGQRDRFCRESVLESKYWVVLHRPFETAGITAEYWIPAKKLGAFNKSISGRIRPREGFFGPSFVGWVPDAYGLAGKDAATQLATLAKTWDYSTFDVAHEISANRKSVYLNCLFWAQHDFAASGVSWQQRDDFISNLKKLWELNRIDVPLPGELSQPPLAPD
jgi:hypothetical protein